jgi:hypothetical protein
MSDRPAARIGAATTAGPRCRAAHAPADRVREDVLPFNAGRRCRLFAAPRVDLLACRVTARVIIALGWNSAVLGADSHAVRGDVGKDVTAGVNIAPMAALPGDGMRLACCDCSEAGLGKLSLAFLMLTCDIPCNYAIRQASYAPTVLASVSAPANLLHQALRCEWRSGTWRVLLNHRSRHPLGHQQVMSSTRRALRGKIDSFSHRP